MRAIDSLFSPIFLSLDSQLLLVFEDSRPVGFPDLIPFWKSFPWCFKFSAYQDFPAFVSFWCFNTFRFSVCFTLVLKIIKLYCFQAFKFNDLIRCCVGNTYFFSIRKYQNDIFTFEEKKGSRKFHISLPKQWLGDAIIDLLQYPIKDPFFRQAKGDYDIYWLLKKQNQFGWCLEFFDGYFLT